MSQLKQLQSMQNLYNLCTCTASK